MKIKPISILSMFSAAALAAMVSGCASAGHPFTSAQAMMLSDLPPVVQTTVRTQAGNWPIAAIYMETYNGQPVYEIELERTSNLVGKPAFVVASNGAIIKESRGMAGIAPAY